MNDGIEKLQECAYDMNQMQCDDVLVLAAQIEREHASELQTIEERYKTDLQNAREARDIAIKEAAELRDRLMPHGMEWPRFDDGEKITWNNSPDHTAAICLALDGSCYSLHYDMPDDERMCIYEVSERVKRPVTEVLGADGVPIKVGETVYGTGREQDVYTVISTRKEAQGRFSIECTDSDGEECMADPTQLTHTPPDTQKRIDDDATLPPEVYCAYILHIGSSELGDYSECTEAMALDLLRRQRELCAKGGE